MPPPVLHSLPLMGIGNGAVYAFAARGQCSLPLMGIGNFKRAAPERPPGGTVCSSLPLMGIGNPLSASAFHTAGA